MRLGRWIGQGDQKGLRKLKLRINAQPQRQDLVFAGASILANLMQDDSAFWIRRSDWEEDPARAMTRLMH